MVLQWLQWNSKIRLSQCSTHVNTFYILHIFLCSSLSQSWSVPVQSMFQPFISVRHLISSHLLSVFCSHLSYICLHPSPNLFVTCIQLCFTYFVFILYFISDVLLLLCIPWLKLFPCEITWKWVPQEERVLSILHLGTLREPQGRWSVNSCCWAVRPNFSFSWLTCVLGIWIP